MDHWLAALAQIDTALFRWINGGHNPFFDRLMPFVTELGHWEVPILAAWTALLLFGGSRGRTAALLVVPLLALSDQLSSNLLKDLLDRPRPCNTLAAVHLLVGCGSSFSLPSSHAANFSAVALHLSWFYPRAAPYLAGWALLVGTSRVYVGVHYPGDVLVGFLVGILAACVVRGLYRGALALRRRQVSASTAR